MSKHHDHNHNSGFTTGLIIGGLIGAVAGILSAPKPGSQMRSELLEKTDDIKAVEKIEIILNDATRKTSSENSII